MWVQRISLRGECVRKEEGRRLDISSILHHRQIHLFSSIIVLTFSCIVTQYFHFNNATVDCWRQCWYFGGVDGGINLFWSQSQCHYLKSPRPMGFHVIMLKKAWLLLRMKRFYVILHLLLTGHRNWRLSTAVTSLYTTTTTWHIMNGGDRIPTYLKSNNHSYAINVDFLSLCS